jgi:mitogen-activated protein kinase 1/3
MMDDWLPVEARAAYSVTKLLGVGAFGQVTQGRDNQTGETVAIKKVINVFSDAHDARCILRELRILREFNRVRHANVVQLKDVMMPESPDDFEGESLLICSFFVS